MTVRTTVTSALVLLGGITFLAASVNAPTAEDLQEVVVEIRRQGNTIVAVPNPVRVTRGQRIDWDNTLGGDVNIYFEAPGLFGPASTRGSAGLRGRRVGQTRGRAIGLVRNNAAVGTYKYDIEAFDADGNRFFIDPEIDCC